MKAMWGRQRVELVLTGARPSRTSTLAHRAAQLVVHGADAERTLLLTFSPRAANEISRRSKQRALSRSREPFLRRDAEDHEWPATPTTVAWCAW